MYLTGCADSNSTSKLPFVHVLILSTIIAALITAPAISALSFSQLRIIIEINATDGDAGIQIFVDADGWKKLQVFDPNGVKVLDVAGKGSVGQQGLTEFFFESAEPSFDDQPLADLLELFPEGNYTFVGETVDGKPLNGHARLNHNLPAEPQIVAPANGATLSANMPVVIDWNAVTGPFPGGNSSVTIVAYQVIVEQVKTSPLRVFSVIVPANVTLVSVSPQFMQPNANYAFEVLAIEAGGNQTISQGAFKTQ